MAHNLSSTTPGSLSSEIEGSHLYEIFFAKSNNSGYIVWKSLFIYDEFDNGFS